MSSLTLPDLILLIHHSSNWDDFVDAVYKSFVQDFIESRPIYNGNKLGLKKYPLIEGKAATFWHMTTSGKVPELQRNLDESRCERIKWPKPIIENSSNVNNVKMWENQRNTKKGIQYRICLCFGDWEYLVVLNKRKNYILPWTAYPIVYKHDKKKLQKEYSNFMKFNP
ncbi:MAG: hypothetical protein KBC42_03650 [Candidatus Pacebacteria bacterium]|nr:hypothetical protein [Candidatus Paceibacterota bacterium]MBP9780991.1 hypothetical protein [Candidatus Paceibacterota bacterium]